MSAQPIFDLVLSNRISPADGAVLLELRRELAFRRRWGRWAGVVRGSFETVE